MCCDELVDAGRPSYFINALQGSGSLTGPVSGLGRLVVRAAASHSGSDRTNQKEGGGATAGAIQLAPGEQPSGWNENLLRASKL